MTFWEFDDLALFGYLDQLGAEFDVEPWDVRSVAGRGMRDPGSARTVGFGLMKRWTVRRTNRNDLPTLASPGATSTMSARTSKEVIAHRR